MTIEPPRVFGVLVTYRRPDALAKTLDRLVSQTRRPDRLLVVDNGASGEVSDLVERAVTSGLPAVYIDAGDNLGPAGGFALGMEQLLVDAGDEDWVFLFDDDDPPFFDDAIADAAGFGAAMVAKDPATGGVGISGGRFDLARGRVIRVGDADIHDAVPVDHITGGGLPAYRVAAIRKVGVFRRELFFGFEELEFGLRLTRAGFRLYADGERWQLRKQVKRDRGLLPAEEISVERATATSVRITSLSWRRYYSLRNLVFILREMGAGSAAFRVALTRGLLKPLLNLPLNPRLGWHGLRIGTRAAVDGWKGRLGRSVEPETG
jgi:rhamnopyranosyl-N-acetylglucosaminyl-diphospho-decaprenol beta-1,3/1,4-galactofuranosyltransferase